MLPAIILTQGVPAHRLLVVPDGLSMAWAGAAPLRAAPETTHLHAEHSTH